MNYLISYKIFENRDDDPDDKDALARFELFESKATMGFYFADTVIVDKDRVYRCIEEYNRTYIKNGEWGGGPVNSEFKKFFTEEMRHKVSQNPWYPMIVLIIDIKSLGIVRLGFNIRTKKCCMAAGWESRHELGHKRDDDRSDMIKYLNRTIYWRNITGENKSLDDTIDLFDLDVQNKIEWEWKEKYDN